MAKQLGKLFCMTCGAKRMHIFGADYIQRGGDASASGAPPITKYCIVECRQCGEVSALKRTGQSHGDSDSADNSVAPRRDNKNSNEQAFSLRGKRQQPLWFVDLSDGHLRRILTGLYTSLQNPDMALFGARMALDRLMTLTLGVQNSFEDGLKAWQDQNKISNKERRIFQPLMTVGQVSDQTISHGGEPHITLLLDTLEQLVCRLFILPTSGKSTTSSLRRGSGTIRVLKTPDGRIVDFSVGFGAHQDTGLAEEDLPLRRRQKSVAAE